MIAMITKLYTAQFISIAWIYNLNFNNVSLLLIITTFILYLLYFNLGSVVLGVVYKQLHKLFPTTQSDIDVVKNAR